MEFTITFIGRVVAKKNRWHRGKGGQIYFDQRHAKAELDALELRVPAEVRGLRLVNPDVFYRFFLPEGTRRYRGWDSDWDGKVTALQDILVKCGVFREDSFRYHNGRKVIEPAVMLPKGDVERTEVTIRYGGQ